MSEDLNKQLKTLEASWDMYEATKKKTIENMKTAVNKETGKKIFSQEQIDEEVKLIESAQDELIDKYVACGGNPEDLTKKRKNINTKMKSVPSDIIDLMESNKESDKVINDDKILSGTETIIEKDYLPNKNSYDPNASFDVIPLPSKGECYKHKNSKIPVAYLTAYDENIIISPNLYNDNKVLDYIIKAKVLNETIDTSELTDGDRDAIILFLRASGYGNEYPITARDNITGKEFDAVVDLSQLKYKEFKLKGDENGWFDYTLPVSKKEIKFKYLSHKDNKLLEKMDNIENSKLRKARLEEFVGEMDEYIESDSEVSVEDKINIRKAIRVIDAWKEGIDDENNTEFSHAITNKLILQVMSVDGVTDKKYIRDFVNNMNVKDARALRKYINENEPGIDYNITVEKPESLGGGSMTVFLQLDEYVFLNVAE